MLSGTRPRGCGTPRPLRGLSLVEMMVGLTLGLVLSLVLAKMLADSATSYGKNQQLARLNQEMRAAMELMAREIRRAGYWGSPAPYGTGALAGVGAGPGYTSPFSSLDVATAGCVLFAYDTDSSGTLTTTGPDERSAFLLDGERIYMRKRSGGTTWTCGNGAGNAWEAITDSRNTRYTALGFTLQTSAPTYVTGSSGPNLRTRYLTITMSAQSTQDAAIRQTLTESVKLVNDLYSPT